MATRTISNAGGNWSSAGTWVEGIIPTAADDVVATATSGNLTVNVTSVCKTLDFTNYVGVFTINSQLSVGNGTAGGSVTLVAAMTYAGTATLIVNTTGSTAIITSNGKVITGALTINGIGATVALADDLTVNGTAAIGATSTTALTLNGNNLYCNAGFTQQKVAGTTTIVLQGSGVITGNSNVNRAMTNPLVFNTAGTYTIGNNGLALNNTFTFITGTLTQNGVTNWLFAATVSLVGVFPTFNRITFVNTTLTLNNTLNVTDVTSANPGSATFVGNQNVNVTTWAVTTSVANITITRDSGILSIGTFTAISRATVIFAGAFDQTIGTLKLGSGVTFTFPSTKTLTITIAYSSDGSWVDPSIIAASVASSAFILALDSTPSYAYKTNFTDVDVTGQTLYVYLSGVLTRTSGITVFTTTPGDSVDPGIAFVKPGTTYKINSANLSGAYPSQRSSGSVG